MFFISTLLIFFIAYSGAVNWDCCSPVNYNATGQAWAKYFDTCT